MPTSPLDQTDFELDHTVQKVNLDRIVDQERSAYKHDRSPVGGCMIQMPGHQPYFYAGVTLKVARSAANEVGANFHFKFPGRA